MQDDLTEFFSNLERADPKILAKRCTVFKVKGNTISRAKNNTIADMAIN